MNKEQMIETIYERVADKSLTFGCKINYRKATEFERYPWNLSNYWGDGRWESNDEWDFYILWIPKDRDNNILNKLINLTINGFNEYDWWVPFLIWDKKTFSKTIMYKDLYKWIKKWIIKIIWHPVMIWDVLDYISNLLISNWEYLVLVDKNKILKLWKNKRKPIEEQSIECIEYIYNLIK